ncbi:MAG: GAF domain-containing protein [Bacteroidales bacterium]
MRITFRKLKHLYLIYGFINVFIIVFIILITVYLYNKQASLFSTESVIGNELMKLNSYKSESFDLAYNHRKDSIIADVGLNKDKTDFISQINNSRLRIDKIGKTANLKNIFISEKISALISDYEILAAENKLLLDYLKKIGNGNSGYILKLNNAASDFRLKLNAGASNQIVNDDFNNSMFMIEVLLRNYDELLLHEIEKELTSIKSKLYLNDTISDDYRYLRISDSYNNFEINYHEIAKTLLAIGLSEDEGLMKELNNRYLKAETRLKDTLQLVQVEKKDTELLAISVLLILFVLVVAFNLGSAIFFIQLSRKFTFAINDHFKFLNQGEFVKIDRKKVPEEVYGLIEGLELFSSRILNSMKSLKLISSGNINIDQDKTNYPELLYNSILQIKQKFESFAGQLADEKNKQIELNWIKHGLDNLSNVMRQEIDDPLRYSSKIIYALIEYLDIPMGAIYLLKEEEGNRFLEMIASFAYGKEKQFYRRISIGEGIIGSAAAEKKTLNLTNVPEAYFSIISGFSETKPKNILVSPINLNEEIYGVIEVASLSRFKEEEIKFVEEVCKAVAYSFAISKVYMDTLKLLEDANLDVAQLKSENESLLLENEKLNQTFNDLKSKSFDNEYLMERINEFAIVINLDLDGNILDVNNRFEQFFKAEKKKFMYSNYREYMIDSNLDFDFEQIWRNLRAGIKHELNQKVTITNQEFILNQHFFPMKDTRGRVKGIKIIAFNISDALKIESNSQF